MGGVAGGTRWWAWGGNRRRGVGRTSRRARRGALVGGRGWERRAKCLDRARAPPDCARPTRRPRSRRRGCDGRGGHGHGVLYLNANSGTTNSGLAEAPFLPRRAGGARQKARLVHAAKRESGCARCHPKYIFTLSHTCHIETLDGARPGNLNEVVLRPSRPRAARAATASVPSAVSIDSPTACVPREPPPLFAVHRQ